MNYGQTIYLGRLANCHSIKCIFPGLAAKEYSATNFRNDSLDIFLARCVQSDGSRNAVFRDGAAILIFLISESSPLLPTTAKRDPPLPLQLVSVLKPPNTRAMLSRTRYQAYCLL
jgi:hypothetical protein